MKGKFWRSNSVLLFMCFRIQCYVVALKNIPDADTTKAWFFANTYSSYNFSCTGFQYKLTVLIFNNCSGILFRDPVGAILNTKKRLMKDPLRLRKKCKKPFGHISFGWFVPSFPLSQWEKDTELNLPMAGVPLTSACSTCQREKV